MGGGSRPPKAQMEHEMFPCMRNSNHDSRKRQPISKVHKNEDG
jgi:hypothetical protein